MPRYDGPIIDAHHHLWMYSAAGFPWLAESGRERLARDFTPADHRAAFEGFPIVGSVWIEAPAADPQAEARRTQAWNAASPSVCNALVAHVPLDAPDVAAQLDRMQAQTPLLRGIRDIVSAASGRASFARTPDLLRSPDFRGGLKALRDRQLSFDLMLLPHQLPDAAALLAELPGLRVAVEHAASPEDQSQAGLRQWRDGLALLAALPSVIVKVSALQVLDADWSLPSLRRVLDPLVELFGASRLCFGSDFPTHDLACPGAVTLDAFLDLTADWPEPEQHEFFCGTAGRFYRIPSSTQRDPS